MIIFWWDAHKVVCSAATLKRELGLNKNSWPNPPALCVPQGKLQQTFLSQAQILVHLCSLRLK